MVSVNRDATDEQVWQPLERANDREALRIHSCPSLLRTPKRAKQKSQWLMHHVRDCNAAANSTVGTWVIQLFQNLSLATENIITEDPGFK